MAVSRSPKLDAIPGQNHVLWFNAQTPGVYQGYCSEFCNSTPDDCAAGSICTNLGPGPLGSPVCMQTCTTGAQCRAGYACVDLGYPKKICR